MWIWDNFIHTMIDIMQLSFKKKLSGSGFSMTTQLPCGRAREHNPWLSLRIQPQSRCSQLVCREAGGWWHQIVTCGCTGQETSLYFHRGWIGEPLSPLWLSGLTGDSYTKLEERSSYMVHQTKLGQASGPGTSGFKDREQQSSTCIRCLSALGSREQPLPVCPLPYFSKR